MRKLWIAFAGLLLAACASEIAPAIDGVTTEIAPTATETPLPTETPTPTITPSPQPERHTSVLMGTDWDSAYPERVQFGQRTDVLVLATWVGTWEGELTDFALIRLPRDLRGAAAGDLDRNRRALEVLAAMARQYPEQMGDIGSWSAGQWIEIWGIFSQFISSDVQLSDIQDLFHLVPQALKQDISSWNTIRFTLMEVNFWRTPLYGASVLVPTVELDGWIHCMLTEEQPDAEILRASCTAQYTAPLVADEETTSP